MGKEKTKEKRKAEEVRKWKRKIAPEHWRHTCVWFSPQQEEESGLGGCYTLKSDIAHKQAPWGIKCKDLYSENRDLVCSSAESLLRSKIGEGEGGSA